MLKQTLKFQYFGYLMWRVDSLEKTLMLGKIEGRMRRGWQRMRWLSLTWWTWVCPNSRRWWRTGCATVPGVANCQTWLVEQPHDFASRTAASCVRAELKWKEPYLWATRHMILFISSSQLGITLRLYTGPVASGYYILESSIFSGYLFFFFSGYLMCQSTVMLQYLIGRS